MALTDVIVSADGASFTWERGIEPALVDINLTLRRASLTALVGRIGAGKSSLIQALLGQMVI